jgi:hypothetical protein
MHFAAVVKAKFEQVDTPETKNMKTLLLSKNIKPKNGDRSSKKQKFKEYKALLDSVTTKMEKMHDSEAMRRKGKFKNDEDFFEFEQLSSHFHSSRGSSSNDISPGSKPDSSRESPMLNLEIQKMIRRKSSTKKVSIQPP